MSCAMGKLDLLVEVDRLSGQGYKAQQTARGDGSRPHEYLLSGKDRSVTIYVDEGNSECYAMPGNTAGLPLDLDDYINTRLVLIAMVEQVRRPDVNLELLAV